MPSLSDDEQRVLDIVVEQQLRANQRWVRDDHAALTLGIDSEKVATSAQRTLGERGYATIERHTVSLTARGLLASKFGKDIEALARRFLGFTSAHFGRSNGSGLYRIPIGGGPVDTLTLLVAPYGMAIDANNVYAVDGGAIWQVPKGGAPQLLLNREPTPTRIAVDASSVYWTTSTLGGSVRKIPIGGGTSTTLAQGLMQPQGIVVDVNGVYFATLDGVVYRVPLAGGALVTLAQGQNTPTSLAIDATSLYWTNMAANILNSGSVMKMALGGGTPTVLAAAQDRPFGIAIDATYVYWTNQGGTVMRVPK